MAEKQLKSSKKKHSRKHGFLKRNQSRAGKLVLKKRRLKGRKSK